MISTSYHRNAFSVVVSMIRIVRTAAFSMVMLSACSERTSGHADLVAFERGDFIAQSVDHCSVRGIMVPCIHGVSSGLSEHSVWRLNEDSSLLVPLLDDSLGTVAACVSDDSMSAQLINSPIPRIAIRWTPEGSVETSELPPDLTTELESYRLSLSTERSAVHIITSKALYTKYRSAASWKVTTVPDSLLKHTIGDIRDVYAEQSGNLLVAYDAGEFGGSLLRIEDVHGKAHMRCIVSGRPVSIIRRIRGSSFIIAGSRQHMRQCSTWIAVLSHDSVRFVVDQETMSRGSHVNGNSTVPLSLPAGSTVTDVIVTDSSVLLLLPEYGIYRIAAELLTPRPSVDGASPTVQRYQSWHHTRGSANGLFLDDNRVLLQFRSTEAYIVSVDSGSVLYLP